MSAHHDLINRLKMYIYFDKIMKEILHIYYSRSAHTEKQFTCFLKC